MRLSGVFLLVMLLAVGVVLYLQGRSTREDLDAVQRVATDLRERGVEGRSLDRAAAEEAIAALQTLTADREMAAGHLEDLKAIASTAASWAQAAPSPSWELTAAVAIRGAADDLRSWAVRGDARHLGRARTRLAEARAALTNRQEGAPMPGGPTRAIRDRLDNLQHSADEQMQELDEALR